MTNAPLPPIPTRRTPTWVLHLPDHSEVPLETRLIVGRGQPSDAIGQSLEPFADVSREHLELEPRNGRLYVKHLSRNSVTFLVTHQAGGIVEEHLPPEGLELDSPAVFRLGDHAYIQAHHP